MLRLRLCKMPTCSGRSLLTLSGRRAAFPSPPRGAADQVTSARSAVSSRHDVVRFPFTLAKSALFLARLGRKGDCSELAGSGVQHEVALGTGGGRRRRRRFPSSRSRFSSKHNKRGQRSLGAGLAQGLVYKRLRDPDQHSSSSALVFTRLELITPPLAAYRRRGPSDHQSGSVNSCASSSERFGHRTRFHLAPLLTD